MLEIGKTVTLEVLRAVPMGLILGSVEDEVLLPKRYVPKGTSVGDGIEVFLYTDSEDRPIATTQKPLAQAGEFAFVLFSFATQQGGLGLDVTSPLVAVVALTMALTPMLMLTVMQVTP